MFKNLKIAVRLMGLLGLLVLVLAVISVMAQMYLSAAKRDLEQTYSDKLIPTRMSYRVQRYAEDTRIQLMLGLQHNPASSLAKLHDHPLTMHLETIAKAQADIEAGLKEVTAGRQVVGQKTSFSSISRKHSAAVSPRKTVNHLPV